MSYSLLILKKNTMFVIIILDVKEVIDVNKDVNNDSYNKIDYDLNNPRNYSLSEDLINELKENDDKPKKTKKRKISIQKIFNILSFIFILSCIIYYGCRFVKFYKESHTKPTEKFIADIIKENNTDNENFKNINSDYYFYDNTENNYLKYSNLTWRIIKVNNDNTITLILNNPITVLSMGKNNDYKTSYIDSWFNNKDENDTGILEKMLNNSSNYLVPTRTCIDKIDNIKNITCKETLDNSLITLPSLNDYANTGSSKSFMNSEENFYLSNSNGKSKTWYVDETGKVDVIDNNSVIGIKPVITLKKNTFLIKGDGTKENPYEIEETPSLFASYVKLGNDLWQVYDVEEETIKLSLTTYLKINGEEIRYKYSNSDYFYDDTKVGSLAYYLNHDYLNSLSYKDIINENKYSNGIYNESDNYNYINTLNTKINTKVSLLSIGNIFLNNKSNNYYTSTSLNKDSNLMYVMNNNFKVTNTTLTDELSIIPVISINKNILSKGNGTIESPYEV